MAAPKKAAPAAARLRIARPIEGRLTPMRCRQYVREKIAEHLPEVCDGLLDKAKDGNLAAVKALLQMAALDGNAAKGAGDSKKAGTTQPLTKQLAFVRKTLAEFRQDGSG